MSLHKVSCVFAVVMAGMTLVACNNDGGGGGAEAGPSDPGSVRRPTESPLHAAAMRNDEQTIRQLTTQGTDPNVQLKNGRTALHYAAAEGQMRAASALLQAGAKADMPDDRGDTPLMTAANHGKDR